jgi:chemosensory pili system protein ChpA (sensor histidine kinase/response regulator)
MRLAGLERSGEIIAACGRFVGRDIIDRRRTPDWESLDALADAITSVEYYLEGLAAVAGEEDQSVLDIAERNIAKLGYEARAANVVSLVAAAPPAQADGTVTGEENRPEQTETGDGEPETLAVDGGEEPDSGDEVDPEIKEIFIDEAREVLDTLATSVPNWLDNSQDSALIETRRAFHTLKGSGRMVGAEDIGELAWALENMLNRLIDHKIEEGPLLRRTVEDVVELLPALLADFDAGNSGVAPEMLDALVERCEGLAEGRDETEIMGESAKATGQPLQPVPEPGTLTPDQEAEQAPEQEPDQGPDVDEEALASTGAELAQAADEDVAGPEADDELLAIFSAEAETYLAVVRNFVAAQRRKSPFYDVPDNALQSALHTLKGSAYMADIGSVAEIVTPLERFLREMRNFRLPVNGEILDLLDEAVACCEASRNEAWHRGTALPDNRALQARIESVRGRVVDTAIEERVDAQLGGDPADLERVMREGMENLMAADRLFADCREGTDQCWRALADLPPELRELQKAAERADIPVLADLAGVLAGACDNLADLRTVPDEESITRLAQAHETLIAMVDAVAAHQEVEPAGGALMAALAEMASRQAEQSGPDSGRDADIVPASATGMIRQALDEEYAGAAENFEPDDTPHEAGSEESGTEAAQIDMTPETSTREEGESAAADEHVEHDPAEADRIPGAGDREEATSPPSDIGVLPEDTDPEILDIFLAEADELLEEIEQALQAWSENPSDNSWPERLKRALHTFKGGARMAGLDAMGTASHDFESLVQDSEGAPASAIPMPEMLQRYDRLLNATEQIRAAMHGTPEAAPQPVETQEPEPGPQVTPPSTDQGSPPPGGDDEGWPSARVLPFTGTPQGFEVDPVTEVPPAPEKKRMPQEMVKISAPMLDTLVNLAGETSISRSQVEQQISEFVFSLDEMQATIRRMQDQVRRLSVETDAQITFRREQIETSVGEEEFDPLEMDRYSQLQQLSRSMLESASDLQDLRDTLLDKSRDAESLLLHQSRINTDLQEGLMRTRMVPFSRLVPRLRRIVRQVAGELDKDVALKLGSVEGEIDRSVMERILPSLEHMIRNAIDHGLEDREHRLEAGKPEEGTISLSFSREGGDVLIRLSDDGRGLDVEAIRRKALEKGLIREDASLSEQEIMQFIFQPGFSTSTRVTEVSGRGVGMDVVNSEVRQLGGNIAIATRIDQGTEFSVRLPFTVSVNRALMIAVGEDTFALALDSIRGVVRLAVDELVTYYRDPDARLRYGGEDYEIRHLGTLLDPQLRPTLDTLEGKVALILVYSEGRHYALQVDDLLGSREIVVKTLGPQFSRVPGLSGATILGDGRVVVILDLQGLLRAQKTVPVIAPVVPRERDSSDPHRVRTIMVVDDSVTVRKVTGRFLGREGFEVITAKDGLDAMRVLQDNTPDLMLLDIEMPGMDGFEVARLVRSTQRLKSLPIIMITSRTGEKHRERALAMGVDRYLGKPYREDVLLHNVYDLLKAKETG